MGLKWGHSCGHTDHFAKCFQNRDMTATIYYIWQKLSQEGSEGLAPLHGQLTLSLTFTKGLCFQGSDPDHLDTSCLSLARQAAGRKCYELLSNWGTFQTP